MAIAAPNLRLTGRKFHNPLIFDSKQLICLSHHDPHLSAHPAMPRSFRRRRRRVATGPRVLRLESLENRQLLATVASFDNDRASAAYAIRVDGSALPPAELGGGTIPGTKEFLRIYSGIPNNLNSVAFTRTDAGPQGNILADFEFRMTPVYERPDGLSFSLVNTSNYGVSGPVL